MKYIELKTKILNNVLSINKYDFYLLEGKLVFKTLAKANLVKEYLEKENYIVLQTPVRNWDHWENSYESIIYLKDLSKENTSYNEYDSSWSHS